MAEKYIAQTSTLLGRSVKGFLSDIAKTFPIVAFLTKNARCLAYEIKSCGKSARVVLGLRDNVLLQLSA